MSRERIWLWCNCFKKMKLSAYRFCDLIWQQTLIIDVPISPAFVESKPIYDFKTDWEEARAFYFKRFSKPNSLQNVRQWYRKKGNPKIFFYIFELKSEISTISMTNLDWIFIVFPGLKKNIYNEISPFPAQHKMKHVAWNKVG